MKKTLLVDINRAAVAIYRALCDMGHDVWVVGGKPTETLAKLAGNYMELDYSDAGRLAALCFSKILDVIPLKFNKCVNRCEEAKHIRQWICFFVLHNGNKTGHE
jgi:hypothetical protein